MDTMEVEEKFTPPVKRKKKRSFMTNVKKKFGKSSFAKGSHIEEDSYQYFIRVLELERQEFDSLDEKRIFVNNALDQTIGHETEYSSNQLVSRVLENLLPLASEASLIRFLKSFGNDLRPICGDMFASHILQKLIVLATKQAINTAEKDEETEVYIKPEPGSHAHECYMWVSKVAKFMLNNLEDFVWERSSNHILRTLLYSLSGSPDSGKQQQETKQEHFTVPAEFTDLYIQFTKRLLAWPQFSDFAFQELTSGLLQVLLKTLKMVDSKLNKTVMRKLLTEVYYPYNLNGTLDVALFEKSPAVHLLECIIESCGNKLYAKLFAKFFAGNLSTLAQMGSANFTVQKLINRCNEKSNCEVIMEELCPRLPDVLKSKHTGVMLSLCQACERLASKQSDFVKGLEQALNLEGEEQEGLLAMHTIKMVPYQRNQTSVTSAPISLHGSLMLQSMLRFKKPIKIINSLLAIDASVLCSILCDPRGSHIMDTFVTAQFVGEKSREKLVRHLKGCYVTLAISKHGSRSFDKIWSTAGLKHKTQIAAELSAKESKVMSTEFGKFVALKTSLSTFRHHPDEWKNVVSQNDKTKKLFADIIGDTAVK